VTRPSFSRKVRREQSRTRYAGFLLTKGDDDRPLYGSVPFSFPGRKKTPPLSPPPKTNPRPPPPPKNTVCPPPPPMACSSSFPPQGPRSFFPRRQDGNIGMRQTPPFFPSPAFPKPPPSSIHPILCPLFLLGTAGPYSPLPLSWARVVTGFSRPLTQPERRPPQTWSISCIAKRTSPFPMMHYWYIFLVMGGLGPFP